MKNIFLSSLLILATGLFCGCSGPKSPSFEKLEKLKVVSAKKNRVVLNGDALYHNPNDISGMLTNTNIKILVNDVQVSEINQEHAIAVPKSGDFKIPVNISFNPQKIMKENKGFLRKTLRSFIDKKMEIQYFGTVTIQIMGIDFDVPVDYTEKVSVGISYD